MRYFHWTMFLLQTCLVMLSTEVSAQDSLTGLQTERIMITGSPAPEPAFSKKKRQLIVGGFEGAFTAGSFWALNKAWYSNYPKEKFHLFNDWDEWMQVDKLGHVLSTYSGARISADMWRWAGTERKKAAWIGSLTSLSYQTMVEVLDGFSEKWGFSPGDMYMNIAGAALFLGQDLAWRQQRLTLKISIFPVGYDPSVQGRADALFGTSWTERWLKDYNGQTYWLSCNLRSFFPDSRIPAWLNLSLGHNARLMLGGTENKWTDESGQTVDRSDIQRYRRFFLSADIDLTRIPTRSKFLKSAFSFINIIKIPAPALEWDTRGGFRGHLLYF
jgi:hypothetical protein